MNQPSYTDISQSTILYKIKVKKGEIIDITDEFC